MSLPPKFKHDYDSLKEAGFQWCAHDPALSGGSGTLHKDLQVHHGTPERFTWKRWFEKTYAELGSVLRPAVTCEPVEPVTLEEPVDADH